MLKYVGSTLFLLSANLFSMGQKCIEMKQRCVSYNCDPALIARHISLDELQEANNERLHSQMNLMANYVYWAVNGNGTSDWFKSKKQAIKQLEALGNLLEWSMIEHHEKTYVENKIGTLEKEIEQLKKEIAETAHMLSVFKIK